MYDYMDFDEFLTFMSYYDEYERAEQERIFKQYDEDSSGNISAADSGPKGAVKRSASE